MGALDRSITLVTLLKWEAPGGTVRLCDGGFVDFNGERYEAAHAVWGRVAQWPSLDASMDELAEAASVTLLPDAGATLSAWWRADVLDTRMRVWLGELQADGLTVNAATATQLADLLVDNAARAQGPDGSDALELDLTGRAERLFVIDEGNVCSDRFHQTVWPGELGFANCTDVQGQFAWGTALSSAEDPVKGGKKKNKGNKGD